VTSVSPRSNCSSASLIGPPAKTYEKSPPANGSRRALSQLSSGAKRP